MAEIKFEANIRLVLYARSQGDALQEIEKRLRGEHGGGLNDPAALLVEETQIRRAKDQR